MQLHQLGVRYASNYYSYIPTTAAAVVSLDLESFEVDESYCYIMWTSHIPEYTRVAHDGWAYDLPMPCM